MFRQYNGSSTGPRNHYNRPAPHGTASYVTTPHVTAPHVATQPPYPGYDKLLPVRDVDLPCVICSDRYTGTGK